MASSVSRKRQINARARASKAPAARATDRCRANENSRCPPSLSLLFVRFLFLFFGTSCTGSLSTTRATFVAFIAAAPLVLLCQGPTPFPLAKVQIACYDHSDWGLDRGVAWQTLRMARAMRLLAATGAVAAGLSRCRLEQARLLLRNHRELNVNHFNNCIARQKGS